MKGFSLVFISLLFALSTAASYDHFMAVKLSKVAFASYCPANKLEGLKCGEKCNALKGYTFLMQAEYPICSFQSVSYSSFINPAEKRVIVSFRGTSGFVQLTNEIALSVGVKFDLCPNVQNAKALFYFYSGYETKIRNGLLSQMRTLVRLYPDYEFYLTGHSLGGALATLAALDLSCNSVLPKKQIHLWTFGSPRVGDINLATAVVQHVGEHFRITHHKDLVVHVPPCKINAFGRCSSEKTPIMDALTGLFNYGWHVWPEVHYAQDFSYYTICDTSEHTSCANQFTLPLTSIGDHKSYFGSQTTCDA